MKELLKSIASPADLLAVTQEELARALLRSMQERRGDPIHPVNRDSAVSELFSIADPISPVDRRNLEKKLDTVFRKAFEQLESWELIEPAEGDNGKNGYVVLTEKGVEHEARLDFERLRQRRLLVAEMLHPLLRGAFIMIFSRANSAGPSLVRSKSSRCRSARRRSCPNPIMARYLCRSRSMKRTGR
jgi:hypothetical protein